TNSLIGESISRGREFTELPCILLSKTFKVLDAVLLTLTILAPHLGDPLSEFPGSQVLASLRLIGCRVVRPHEEISDWVATHHEVVRLANEVCQCRGSLVIRKRGPHVVKELEPLAEPT